MAGSSGVSRETFQQLHHDLKARPRAVHQGSFNNDSAALGEWSCSSVFMQKLRKTSQGGRIWPSKEDLQDSLPMRAEDTQPDPRSRGMGSSQHHHSTFPRPTVCGVILLQMLRLEPRAAASPGKHHPAFTASLLCSALRTDPMGAVALHWESTGSRRHGWGLLRTLQNNPTHGKASK